jgi:hypothetical protein
MFTALMVDAQNRHDLKPTEPKPIDTDIQNILFG